MTTRQTAGKDRELDATLLLIDIESKASRVLGAADNVMFDAPGSRPMAAPSPQCI